MTKLLENKKIYETETKQVFMFFYTKEMKLAIDYQKKKKKSD